MEPGLAAGQKERTPILESEAGAAEHQPCDMRAMAAVGINVGGSIERLVVLEIGIVDRPEAGEPGTEFQFLLDEEFTRIAVRVERRDVCLAWDCIRIFERHAEKAVVDDQ